MVEINNLGTVFISALRVESKGEKIYMSVNS